MNRSSYVFAAATTIFLPLGFVTGLFGVNLMGLPMEDSPQGFWILTAICLGSALGCWRCSAGANGCDPDLADHEATREGLLWCSTTSATITSYSVKTSALPRSLAYLCSGWTSHSSIASKLSK